MNIVKRYQLLQRVLPFPEDVIDEIGEYIFGSCAVTVVNDHEFLMAIVPYQNGKCGFITVHDPYLHLPITANLNASPVP